MNIQSITRPEAYALLMYRAHTSLLDAIHYASQASAAAPMNSQAAIVYSLAYRLALVLDGCGPDDYSVTEAAEEALLGLEGT